MENQITPEEKKLWLEYQNTVAGALLALPKYHSAIAAGTVELDEIVTGISNWADLMLCEAKKRGCV